MLYLMVFFIFMAVVFALIGLIKSFSTRNLYVERLHAVMGSVEANKRGEKLTMKATLASLLKSVSQLFASNSSTGRLQSRLVEAGIPLKGEEYISISLGVMLFVPLLTYGISTNARLAILALIPSLLLPEFYIKIKTGAYSPLTSNWQTLWLSWLMPLGLVLVFSRPWRP